MVGTSNDWNQLVREIEEIEEMIAETNPAEDPDTSWAKQLLERKLARKRWSLKRMFNNQPGEPQYL